MHRRDFLHSGVMATLAASVLGDVTLARGGAQAPATPPAASPAAGAAQGAAPATAVPARRLQMDCYTRVLQWIRDPEEIADAAIEMTFSGVEPTITGGAGHIDPAKVTTELPAFVKVMQKHGLKVTQVRGGNQTSVEQPNLEPMVAAMGQCGARYYWCGTDNYDFSKPLQPQLDAIKKKVEAFVKLNEKHNTTLMYHTRAGANSVGSVVWDLLYVMKDFDPKYVGFHWDSGHMALHGGNMWELLLRTAGPYVVAMSWKDRSWQQNLGFLGEGGPFPGPDPTAAAAAANSGRGGRGRGAADAGRGEGAPAGGARGAGGEGESAPGGRGRGRGGLRGGGSREFPLPLAGTTFARGGGWTSPMVPMGQGMVDIFRYATALRDMGFSGPMELEAEYPLGGVERGADKITLPREQVIGALKRDVLTIRAALQQSGSGLVI
jgi:sugar phosphate isomerase/epimerase